MTSDNRICCIFAENENTTCKSTTPPGPLDHCGSLFPNNSLRVAGWILGLSSLIGNAIVVFLRLQHRISRVTAVQNQLMISLAVADGTMGAYMVIITSADLYYGKLYFLSAPHWRESSLCNLAGFLGFVSCESSVFTLCLITLDRLMVIVFPFGRFRIKENVSRVLIAFNWIFTILIGVVLSTVQSKIDGLYGLSDVCLGLPLHVESGELQVSIENEYDISGAVIGINSRFTGSEPKPVWWFSLLIFIGVNLLSFIFIMASYIAMFVKIRRSAQATKNAASLKRELKVAQRMAVIILTDLCCWMPVIVMGILTQTGLVELPPSVYAWTVIFIIPINSSLNPFIYTFMIYMDSTKHFGVLSSSILQNTIRRRRSVELSEMSGDRKKEQPAE